MPTPTFYFISGLSRAGTPLLAALLKQNPRFHASMTSGLGSLVSGAMQIMSPGSDTLKDGQRATILPPDLFKEFQGMDFWRDLAGTRAHVIAAQGHSETMTESHSQANATV
jgi:hypothetical protein